MRRDIFFNGLRGAPLLRGECTVSDHLWLDPGEYSLVWHIGDETAGPVDVRSYALPPLPEVLPLCLATVPDREAGDEPLLVLHVGNCGSAPLDFANVLQALELEFVAGSVRYRSRTWDGHSLISPGGAWSWLLRPSDFEPMIPRGRHRMHARSGVCVSNDVDVIL